MQVFSKHIPWLFCLAIVFGLHYYWLTNIVHFTQGIALIDSSVSLVVMAAAIWCIFLVIRNYPTPVALVFYAVIISVLFSMAGCSIDFFVLKWLIGSKDNIYDAQLFHDLPFRLVAYCLIYGWAGTYIAFKKKNTSLETKFKMQADAATLHREAELFKLRQQLQPHFLYNSLNSISALIMIQPSKAQEMIGKLSDFLRSSVKREAKNLIPVADEWEYIQSYLAIEAVRFGDRLQVDFNREYVDDASIPPFLLQPVLENAIKFGIYGSTGQVTIAVHLVLRDSILYITVTNPYDSSGQTPPGTGFGLEGIRRRLYLLYARMDLLETRKDENTFTTILKIPQAHV